MESLKIVVVGDDMVGKTSMLMAYADNTFSEDHVPTSLGSYMANVMVDSGPEKPQVVSIHLWDIACQKEYDNLRSVSYFDTDVFILCFSLVSPASLASAMSKWVPELRVHDQLKGSTTPILLVGTKSDIRNGRLLASQAQPDAASDGSSSPTTSESVSHAEGLAASQQHGCAAYVECSARTRDGIKMVFEATVHAGLKKKADERQGGRKKTGCLGCSIM